jgi:hypothetical protein
MVGPSAGEREERVEMSKSDEKFMIVAGVIGLNELEEEEAEVESW